MYKTKLDNILHYIDMAYELLQCNNEVCHVKEHVNGICKLHDYIVSICLDASEIRVLAGMENYAMKEKFLYLGGVFGLV